MGPGRRTATEPQAQEPEGSPIWTAHTASDWTPPTLEEGQRKPDLGLLDETSQGWGHTQSPPGAGEKLPVQVLRHLPHQVAA